MDHQSSKMPCSLRTCPLSPQILLLPSPLHGLHHGGGLSRLSKPPAPGQGPGRHLRGAVPQLHSRALTAAFLPADLRLLTGETPGGIAGLGRGLHQDSVEGGRPDGAGVQSPSNLWLHPVWPATKQNPNSRPGSPSPSVPQPPSMAPCTLLSINTRERGAPQALPPFFEMNCSSFPTSTKLKPPLTVSLHLPQHGRPSPCSVVG